MPRITIGAWHIFAIPRTIWLGIQNALQCATLRGQDSQLAISHSIIEPDKPLLDYHTIRAQLCAERDELRQRIKIPFILVKGDKWNSVRLLE